MDDDDELRRKRRKYRRDEDDSAERDRRRKRSRDKRSPSPVRSRDKRRGSRERQRSPSREARARDTSRRDRQADERRDRQTDERRDKDRRRSKERRSRSRDRRPSRTESKKRRYDSTDVSSVVDSPVPGTQPKKEQSRGPSTDGDGSVRGQSVLSDHQQKLLASRASSVSSVEVPRNDDDDTQVGFLCPVDQQLRKSLTLFGKEHSVTRTTGGRKKYTNYAKIRFRQGSRKSDVRLSIRKSLPRIMFEVCDTSTYTEPSYAELTITFMRLSEGRPLRRT